MNKAQSITVYLVTLSLSAMLSTAGTAQAITGVWQNVDDTDGKPKSHIEISESHGKLTGKVIKLLPAATITVCDKCSGSRKNQPLVGMEILWDLEQQGRSEASGGKIVDPASGKEYRCKVSLDGPDVLDVRGYIGTPLLGRTQQWYRVK